ncbi:MAG TPA: DUF305 domain-containing protein [Pseudonocardia sp.]|jgi:uncharacterized protein (DUF305 family)|nr:DUF305 domain-containing protein [Pseudonocardia sp.]
MNTRKLTHLLAGATASALLLAGCGGGQETATTTSPGAGAASSTTAAEAEHNEADVVFAQGMIPHHRQAVAMAELAASRTDDPEVLDLAGRVGLAQEPEIELMISWLEEWDAEVPEGTGMPGMDGGGMNHGGMDGGGMGGMMTPEQMTQLEQGSGSAFDRMFLEMMTEHHRGAIEMAQTQLAEGADPEALELAQTIIETQRAEIEEMEQLLQQL